MHAMRTKKKKKELARRINVQRTIEDIGLMVSIKASIFP